VRHRTPLTWRRRHPGPAPGCPPRHRRNRLVRYPDRKVFSPSPPVDTRAAIAGSPGTSADHRCPTRREGEPLLQALRSLVRVCPRQASAVSSAERSPKAHGTSIKKLFKGARAARRRTILSGNSFAFFGGAYDSSSQSGQVLHHRAGCSYPSSFTEKRLSISDAATSSTRIAVSAEITAKTANLRCAFGARIRQRGTAASSTPRGPPDMDIPRNKKAAGDRGFFEQGTF